VPPPVELAAAQQAKLAAQMLSPAIDELRNDIREIRGSQRKEFLFLLSALVAGFLVLAGLSINVYNRTNDRLASDVTRLETAIEKQSDRIAKQNEQMATMNAMLSRIDQRLEDLLHPPQMPPRRP
jgi:outer membrane murein-binding lipoprotein Lpp